MQPAALAAGPDDTVLGKVRMQGVDQGGLLPNQQVAGLVHHQNGLLLYGLHCHAITQGRLLLSASGSV